MTAKGFGTAMALALMGALGASCAQPSRSSAGAPASAGATGPSGAAEMGRGRCEALTGAAQEKCFADERGQRSDDRK